MSVRTDLATHYGRRRPRRTPLGRRQIEILTEAASEVSRACPWITVDSDGRLVASLVDRGLLATTGTLFGIMPLGCWRLRLHDRALAKAALKGLRRNLEEGEVVPWHI